MPTPKFICGAECGIAVAGTASAGTEHWSIITGSPSVSTTTTNNGARSFRCNPSAATSILRHAFAVAIPSPATYVARFYVRFATLPSANTKLFWDDFSTGVGYKQSNTTITTVDTSGTYGATGVTVTTGVWYRVDVKTVLNTTSTIDIQVDGVAVTQQVGSTGASAGNNLFIGIGDTCTADAFFDDIIVSGTSADYPIGAGLVVGLYPNADGTHGGGWASGVFGKGTGGTTNAANSDTDIWSSLDNPLVSTAAGSWVANNTATVTTNYVEFRNQGMPPTMLVNGAMLVFTSHSASATTNNVNIDINDGAGHTATLVTTLDLSETTITIPVVIRNTDANGVAWTPDTLGANRLRFSGTDSNPDAYLDGYCFEVDYVPQPGGRNVYVNPPAHVQQLSRW